MSELQVSADAGEHVSTTAQTAIDMATTYKVAVKMTHNDRVVTVQPGDTAESVFARWERMDRETQSQYAVGHVWVAHYSDWSNLAIFADELEALRYALPKQMDVVEWRFGSDAHEATS